MTALHRPCTAPAPPPAPPLHRPRTASAPPLHRLLHRPCTAFVPPPHCLLTACSRSSAGAIGYIDAGHGHEHGLSEVALLNKDGVYLTTKTANIGDAATVALAQGDLIPTDPSADWSAVNLYNLAGPKTWPITMISYFYLEKDLSGMDAKTAALLMAFVKFVLSEEGQAKAEDKLFVKLPAAMQTYNTATLASLTLPAGYAELSFEDSGQESAFMHHSLSRTKISGILMTPQLDAPCLPLTKALARQMTLKSRWARAAR